jgi:hypothetical protein
MMRYSQFSVFSKLVAAVAAAAALVLPALAGAQEQQVPSYGTPVARQESIKGTLTGFDGQYIVYMRDDRGYDDHITLHQGTEINPTGIRLVEGMRVTIWGRADGPTFQANRIDVSPPDYGGSGYGGGYGGGWYPGYYGGYGNPYWGVGLGFWGGWPGWGWGYGWPGWGGFYGGYYGGYPGYYRGPYYYRGGYPGRSGTISAPPRGGGGAVHGGGGAVHGGGGSVHGGPPR